MQKKTGKTGIHVTFDGHKSLMTLLARIAECACDPCFALDARGCVTVWNKAVASLTGIPAKEMIGRSDGEHALPFHGRKEALLVDYALRPELLDDIAGSGVRREGDVLVREECFPGISGGRTFHTRAAALIDARGAVLGAVQSFHEVMDHATGACASAASREKYRTFFENATDFLYIYDLKGDMIETNIASKVHTGYTAEEIIHMNVRDLMPGRYRSTFDRYQDEILRKGGGGGIASILTKDGSERVIEYRNTLVRDSQGYPLYVQGTGRDITDKIKDQRALKISEEKYRNILDSIEEAYFEVDLSGNLTFFNQAALKNLKYTENELKGMNYRQYVDEENAKKVFEVFHQVYTTGKTTKAFDWELQDKYGGKFSVEASVSLLRDAKGNPIGFRGVVRDITQRKEAQRQRDRYEMRLSQAQRMEAIGTLASGIAHDFNNMLSAIMGYTELARTQLPEGSPAEKSLGQVVKAGIRARDLVAQLLSIGRKYQVDREAVKIGVILKEALNLLRATIPTSIEIRAALHPDTGLVYADPTEIHQLIMNLCTNAYQAMEEKGGLLRITLEPVSLKEEKCDEKIQPPIHKGHYLKLTVSDTGSGMDEDTITHIFDPFFTTKERGKGTGLGLATVRRIITELKGGVSVESAPGKGSTFTLFLPRYEGGEEKS